MILRGYRALAANFHRLGAGDVFIGRVPPGPLQGAMLVDLMRRGVRCIPSGLCQLVSGSKAAQALILNPWMLPLTRAVRRRADLIEAVAAYSEKEVGPVVTKEDHLHCGHGIRRWNHVEDLYSTVAFDVSAYPFVLQPLLRNFIDLRVVIAGDYIEAYRRDHPGCLRKNLASGGRSSPVELDSQTVDFCRTVMERAEFPFAHLDLHLPDEGGCHLSEITLSGGIKGARIGRRELDDRKEAILNSLAEPVSGETC